MKRLYFTFIVLSLCISASAQKPNTDVTNNSNTEKTVFTDDETGTNTREELIDDLEKNVDTCNKWLEIWNGPTHSHYTMQNEEVDKAFHTALDNAQLVLDKEEAGTPVTMEELGKTVEELHDAMILWNKTATDQVRNHEIKRENLDVYETEAEQEKEKVTESTKEAYDAWVNSIKVARVAFADMNNDFIILLEKYQAVKDAYSAYQDAKGVPTIFTVTPEGGAIADLKTITIKTADGSFMGATQNDGCNITLYDSDKNVIQIWDMNALVAIEPEYDNSGIPIGLTLTLDKEITEKGSYTLVVDAKVFYYGDDYAENEETTFKWTIVTTGINTITNKNTMADGKYLLNGKLVIVKNGIKYNAVGGRM